MQKERHANFNQKYIALRFKQEDEEAKERGQYTNLREALDGLKDDYLSDLCIKDIPDGEVSDVNEDELDLDSIPLQQSVDHLKNKLKVQEDIIEKYSEANLNFMS